MNREEEAVAYEPPELIEAGDFTEVTLGRPNWGFDSVWTCVELGCWA
ncbi:lasso RiPP family leader peptide-containing protein [Streptomyces jumonjinensis]